METPGTNEPPTDDELVDTGAAITDETSDTLPLRMLLVAIVLMTIQM